MPEIIHNTTALCTAIINSNIEESISIINALTKNDLDERGSNPMSPLHLAAFYGHTAIFDALINKDVNPDLKDSKGQTPIQVVVKEISKRPRHLITAKLLLEKGADLEKIGKEHELYPLLKVIQKLSNDEIKVIKVIDDHHNIIKELSDDEVGVMSSHYKILKKLPDDEITVIGNHLDHFKTISDYISEMNLQKPSTNLRAPTATEVEKRNSRSRT